MTEAFINEDDETAIRKKKFHVGKGVYVDKEKDKDNPKAQRYKKDDSGKYIKTDDKAGDDKEKKTPVSIDIDAAGGLGGDEPKKDVKGREYDPMTGKGKGLDYRGEPDDEEWFKSMMSGDDEPEEDEKEESIKVINGKKYKPIKESVNKRISVKEVYRWLKGLEEYRYRKIPNVDVRRIASFANNGLSETDLPKSLQKKWENAKYSKEKGLADRFMKERINKKLTQNESKHPLKEQYDRLFKK